MQHRAGAAGRSTNLAIECPACGDYSEMPLAWLKTAAVMECANCGASIDLAAPERRGEIDRLYAIAVRTGT